jgi:hypothetical protein
MHHVFSKRLAQRGTGKQGTSADNAPTVPPQRTPATYRRHRQQRWQAIASLLEWEFGTPLRGYYALFTYGPNRTAMPPRRVSCPTSLRMSFASGNGYMSSTPGKSQIVSSGLAESLRAARPSRRGGLIVGPSHIALVRLLAFWYVVCRVPTRERLRTYSIKLSEPRSETTNILSTPYSRQNAVTVGAIRTG